jgi:hypothetical protein
MERKARSKPRPTYPTAHKWEEVVPLLLLHYEPLTKQVKEEKKRTKCKKKKGWVER